MTKIPKINVEVATKWVPGRNLEIRIGYETVDGPEVDRIELLLNQVCMIVAKSVLQSGGFGTVSYIFDPIEGGAVDLRKFNVKMLPASKRQILLENVEMLERDGLVDENTGSQILVRLTMTFIVERRT